MFDNRLRPSSLGVQQHVPCAILQISNPLLSYTVLVVCTYPTVRMRLLLILMLQVLDPGILVEPAIVRMVVHYFDSVLVCVALECFLCIKGLVCTRRLL